MGGQQGACVEECCRALAWDEIVARASKIVTFIDLAGHEKYLKTTVFGLTGCLPDYVMICIGANMGITRMTKEHLGIALALKLPICVVITKVPHWLHALASWLH